LLSVLDEKTLAFGGNTPTNQREPMTRSPTMSALHFTVDNFKNEVLDSDTPVLVDFWADWCPPCRIIAPTIDELAEEYADRIKVGKVDVDANPDLSLKFGISSIPTIILFRDGKIVRRYVGITAKPDFVADLDKAVA